MDVERVTEATGACGHSHTRMTPRRRLLGDLLVREGLISAQQLHEALQEQAGLQTYAPLGQILVDRNVLAQNQLNRVLDKYHKKNRLGDILVETNVITEEQLAEALDHQRRTGCRLGDALVQLTLVTESQMKEALCKQFHVPFIDLDAVALDHALGELVSAAYATHHRVVPIAKLEDRLTVAIDDPAATEVIEDLRAATGCTIDVVIATDAAIQRAQAHLYHAWRGDTVLKALRVTESDPPTHEGAQRDIERRRAYRPAKPPAEETMLIQLQDALAGRLASIEWLQADVGRALEDVRTRQVDTDQRLCALRDTADAHRRADEILRENVHDLTAQQNEIMQQLMELRSAQIAFCAAYGAVGDALRESRERYRALIQDRQDTAEKIEAVLRRLRYEPGLSEHRDDLPLPP
jgi:Fe2+ or Zn2+ uptake regulation protein